ncbi:MAG TPA: molybdate ABC transporter substrate-binding protein [Myxococcota bacterium]|nr:molybdate ABC transporter substrate-binding protein [Myxococcota bacterium]
MSITRRSLFAPFRLALFGLALGGFALGVTPSARAAETSQPELLVFAAASLTNALDEIGAAYAKQTGQPVKGSYAASSALARQLEAGAHADVFFSADTDWMDYAQTHKLIEIATRRDLLGNRLVLIAPAASDVKLEIAPGFKLAEALGKDGRLATGDPDSVPVGRYAKAALTSLGVWKDIEPRLVRADNVRAALAFVSRGEAPLGIVYATDALIDKGVRVVDAFPDSSHPQIVYPIAVVKDARDGAKRYVDFLTTPDAQEIFKKYGFIMLP